MIPIKILITAFMLVLSVASCGEDYTFEPQWEEAGRKANEILAANHLCQLGHSCRSGQNLFLGPHAGGMTVEIYGIQDTRVVWDIAQIFVNEYYSTASMKYLRVQAYSLSHFEENRSSYLFFGGADASLDIVLRRKM